MPNESPYLFDPNRFMIDDILDLVKENKKKIRKKQKMKDKKKGKK